MASVTLTRTWLSLAADLSDALEVVTSDRGDTRSTAGEVRTYANGVLRLVRRAGRRQTVDLTVKAISAATLTKLDGWAGSVVLLRDPWGRKVYGVFLDVSVKDYTDRTVGHDATLSLQQVTYSEAV